MPIFSFIGYSLTKLFRNLGNRQQIYKQTSSTFYASNNVCIKRFETKKLLGRHNKDLFLKICSGSQIGEISV